MKITKDVIHAVIGYSTNEISKSLRNSTCPKIETLTGTKWDGRGVRINTISDPEMIFGEYVIAYKIFKSNRPNSVTCGVDDIAYNIVKKVLQLDLAKLMLR